MYKPNAITKAGKVVGSIPLMCSQISIPDAAGVRLVVSDKGDILSPKKAPETMAPPVNSGGIPSPVPIPINAKPTVPTVPHEEPVAIDIRAQITQTEARKDEGLKISNP